MNLTIILEHRFQMTPDGAVWSRTTGGYSFWKRYLEVFDSVCVLARVQPVANIPDDYRRADGDGVRFAPLPYYVGPVQYVQQSRTLRRAISAALQTPGALILRVPSQIATTAASALPDDRPYGVEVVGDPQDVFAPGAVRHPLRPFFRWWFARNLRRQCAGASAAAYVTAQALQQRYPPAPGAFTTHYSSIELRDEAFAAAPRVFHAPPSPARLVLVGSLEQMYKAPDVLIDAVGRCVGRGLDVHLTLVGDGKHRPELEAQAAAAGLGARVTFAGRVSAGAAVREKLDQADLFMLPSRTEGLPRALIEAMARGLPCIGSSVGGIPELLPADAMVPPGDAQALADKITEMITNPARLTHEAARNLETARAYHEDILRARRIAFYTYVRDFTEKTRKGKSDG